MLETAGPDRAPSVRRDVLLRLAASFENDLGNLERAEAALVQVLAEHDKDPSALASLDRIYENQRMYENLAGVLRQRISTTDDSEELTQLNLRLGRVYAEALEEIPTAPFSALREAGASDGAASAFAVLPQAFPQLVAYTLYRWEVNIRASAVLGVVGAGGLGGLLHVSLNLFHHHRTLTLLAVIVLLVTAVDLLSGAIRRRIVEGPAERTEARPEPEAPAMVDAW